MRPLRLLQIVLILAMGNGCLAKQFKRDGQNQQEAVSEIYTEQAMTNLIRARCNLPFVQLKYDTIAVNDQDHVSGSGNFGYTFTAVRDLILGGSDTSASAYGVTGAADRQRIMSFNSEPITDQNDIYDRYIGFAHDPTLLCVSDHHPNCPVHIHRKYGKKHYWVPVEAGPAFFELVMKTAIMRGEETLPPGFYEVRIVAVTPYSDDAVAGTKRKMTVEFDPKVPNGNGLLTFRMPNGRRCRAQLMEWQPTKAEVANEESKIPTGQLTSKLRIVWDIEKAGFSQEDLPPGLKVRIYSDEFPPEVTSPDPTIRQIGINVTAIKNLTNLQRR